MVADEVGFHDDLGPYKVIEIREPSIGLHAALVIDNVAAGPAIGGLRMAPDVSMAECARLARAMTLKNASARLPHGGGKSVLWGDPRMDPAAKERLVRGFGAAIGEEFSYIPGPDMGTDEVSMAWIRDEIGRAVGLPREIGGIPLDQIGATGYGLKAAAVAVEQFCPFELAGARVVVQGFGAVGQHAARFLQAEGAILVGAADSGGTVSAAAGQALDVERLVELKRSGKSVVDYDPDRAAGPDAVVDIPCDIWIPAARPDVIHAGNVGRLATSLILQGANIPVTAEAEEALHRAGILSVPDFIANAGGVISAAMEYAGATEGLVMARIGETVGGNAEQVLARSKADGIGPRDAAVAMATERVRAAMSTRRWSIF